MCLAIVIQTLRDRPFVFYIMCKSTRRADSIDRGLKREQGLLGVS